MMRVGASSANEPPWSGREISTRVTRKVAAPMESCAPTLPPTAASSLESGQISPAAGIPGAGTPLTKGSAATRSWPRSGYPPVTACTFVNWLSLPLNTTLSSDVMRAVRMSRRPASWKYRSAMGCGEPRRISAASTSVAWMATPALIRLTRNPTPVRAATAIVRANSSTPSSPERHSRARVRRASPSTRMTLPHPAQ